MKFVDAQGEPLVIDLSNTVQHSSRLYNLNLWNESMTGSLRVVKTPAKRVIFTNWLIIGDDHTVSVAANGHAVIGWWKSNTVVNLAAIWWWQTNKANAQYAIVGGWQGNTAGWQNSVVVGWQGNTANKNSLALGQGATSNEGSFAWNHSATTNNWYIDASNWILVNTTDPIDGVNLVVNGAVKIAWTNGSSRLKWEIRYVNKCFYAYDGSKWYVLNRWGENGGNTECKDFTDMAKYCKFGNTVLQNGDTWTGYSQQYATGSNCVTQYEAKVTCNNWTLSPSTHVYPYCYSIHD